MISVYGLNTLGRDEVRGYGAVHLPITPGRFVWLLLVSGTESDCPFFQV